MGQLSEDGEWEWNGADWVPARSTAQRSADGLGAPRPPLATASREVGAEVAGAKVDRRSAWKAARAESRAARVAKRSTDKAARAAAAERKALAASPAGQARRAYVRGDAVFQCSFDVMSQQAVIVAMVGSRTVKGTHDPSETLNSICREGWELLTASFVFIQEGQQSRDKFMSSGQNVATKGTTMGYYLFRRNDSFLVRPGGDDDVMDEALRERAADGVSLVAYEELSLPDSTEDQDPIEDSGIEHGET